MQRHATQEDPSTRGLSATDEAGRAQPPRPAGVMAGESDSSNLEGLDPGLADVVEEYTRRMLAGEPIEGGGLGGDRAWPEEAHGLIPTMLGLAELGRGRGDDAVSAISVDFGGDEGRAFGDFRIIGEVGRGGMGIVYEAEQIAPRRRVALKVLPPASAMDPRALRRFQLEAQVAGWLQHPRIVPLYTVGMVQDVPFYAMQFIEGGSLADLIAELRDAGGDIAGGRQAETGIDDAGPAIRGQAFFRTVALMGIHAAEALGYAHDQGVVHRDVKPANLLLDPRGELWVADFGMADVQGEAGVTLTGDLPGTLRYMSPEQALGKRALVDRRTDIYSLGATLYELLTLRPAALGDDRQEILRRVAEEEPTPIRRLNPSVPVDLATIVTKALAKDPSGRYETARHLADDLRRWLDGLPIAARPVGPVARAWRWCRRKPLQATLAASLALAVVLGFAGVTWGWREALRQKALLLVAEREARMQAGKADAINRFLIDGLLRQAEPSAGPVSRQVTLLEALDRVAASVGTAFADQPDVGAAVRLTIGRTYHGLGEYAKSEAHYRAAVEILGRDPGEPSVIRLEAITELGHLLTHLGRLDEAEPLLRGAIRDARRVLGPYHTASLRPVEYLGRIQAARGHYVQAQATFRGYLEDALHAPSPDQDIVRSARFHLADAILRGGRADEAESLYRQIEADYRLAKGPSHPDTLAALNNLGTVLEKQGRFAEAEGIFRECLALSREVRGPRHPETLTSLYNLGHVLCDLRRFAEAEPLYREHIEASRAVLGPEHPATLKTISGLGALLTAGGHLAEAERWLRPCLQGQRRALGTDHPDTVATAQRLDHLLEEREAAGATGVARPKVAADR